MEVTAINEYGPGRYLIHFRIWSCCGGYSAGTKVVYQDTKPTMEEAKELIA